MTSKNRNRLLVLCILAFPFVVLIGFVISEFARPLPPIPPMPNPNGYDDFVKAGEMVSTNSWNYDKMNLEQLRETTTANAKALSLVRAGLSNECRVPLDYSATSSAHLEGLSTIKLLEHAFAAEGQLAEIENRPSDAAKSYLDIFHLANQSTYGGTMLDEMVGRVMETIGTENLQKLVGQLDSKSCRETAVTLQTLDAQRQTWNEVMQQESDWSRRTFPGLRNELARVTERNSLNKIFQKGEQKLKAQQTRTRQLIIDLASRAYELDKGQKPTNLTDLVPDYLKAIPQDPLTGTNMVYSPR